MLDLGRPDQVAVFEEIFVQGVYELDRVPFEPDRVVDCGAHVGYFSLLAGARFPNAELVAFEPQAENWRCAKEQVEINKKTIEIYRAAVGIEDGRSVLVGSGCGGRLNGEAVDGVSLPRLIREWSPRRLLLKVDIEGGERALLREVVPILPVSTVLFFETHGGLPVLDACAELLTGAGFKVDVLRQRDGEGTSNAYADVVALRHSREGD